VPTFDRLLSLRESPAFRGAKGNNMNEPLPATDKFRRRPLRRILRNWLLRHQHPFNLWIHMVGIPMSLVGVVLLFFRELWPWGLGAIFVGYLFQYIGHKVEGNDVGEWAAVKRLIGWPYVSISPRFQGLTDCHPSSSNAAQTR
jgi:hypothetical protein